ncbi:MAG TPA: gliding motility-associated C-terminal domain-containing protein [Flavobacteriales bacterium]|nr:gliding motility-associated C-terminal domain-containing protein [Flavobacteriales bacterium]
MWVEFEECNTFFPNAFTPDGDGINDEFKLFGDGVINVNLKIFDRWGHVVFETTKPDGAWDGTGNNGQPAGSGVYVYRALIEQVNGYKQEEGWVMLTR